MVYTLNRDEDNDYPPSSILYSLYSAKEWDKWKQIKYKGKSKAESAVEKYHK